MQIILTQTEITRAIEAYIRNNVSIPLSGELSIELKAGRGEDGFTATMDMDMSELSRPVVSESPAADVDEEPVGDSEPAPKKSPAKAKKAATPKAAPKPAPEPEADATEEAPAETETKAADTPAPAEEPTAKAEAPKGIFNFKSQQAG